MSTKKSGIGQAIADGAIVAATETLKPILIAILKDKITDPDEKKLLKQVGLLLAKKVKSEKKGLQAGITLISDVLKGV